MYSGLYFQLRVQPFHSLATYTIRPCHGTVHHLFTYRLMVRSVYIGGVRCALRVTSSPIGPAAVFTTFYVLLRPCDKATSTVDLCSCPWNLGTRLETHLC